MSVPAWDSSPPICNLWMKLHSHPVWCIDETLRMSLEGDAPGKCHTIQAMNLSDVFSERTTETRAAFTSHIALVLVTDGVPPPPTPLEHGCPHADKWPCFQHTEHLCQTGYSLKSEVLEKGNGFSRKVVLISSNSTWCVDWKAKRQKHWGYEFVWTGDRESGGRHCHWQGLLQHKRGTV